MERNQRKIILFTAAAFVIVFGWIYYLNNAYGEVTVNSPYNDANVLINGDDPSRYLKKKESLEKQSFRLRLPKGKYEIEVAKDDYKPFSRNFEVKRNSKASIDVKLELIYDDSQMEELRRDR